jgi:predicted secreted acid phosphatase
MAARSLSSKQHVRMKSLKAALSKNQYDYDINLELAGLMATSARFHDAIDLVDTCLAIDSHSWRAYYCKANIFKRMGLLTKAQQYAKRGLCMHPGNGSLLGQVESLHLLIEHKKLRAEDGMHGEGNLQKYDENISSRVKNILHKALQGGSHGKSAEQMIAFGNDERFSTQTERPAVTNLLNHLGSRRKECLVYYKTVYEKEVSNVLKLGRRYIRGILRRHELEKRAKEDKHKQHVNELVAHANAIEKAKTMEKERLEAKGGVQDEETLSKEEAIVTPTNIREAHPVKEFKLPTYLMFWDIDDTVFCSFPHIKQLDCKKVAAFTPRYLFNTSPKVIPQIMKFYHWLYHNGVKIIFVSERPHYLYQATQAALNNAGLHGYLDLILRKGAESHMPLKSFKKNARKSALLKYRKKYGHLYVLGNLGDQDCDFDDNDSGIRMKLPNYMYSLS